MAGLYADYWPRLFPTIKGVRLIGREGSKQVLEIDHLEGKVVNELVVRHPTSSTSGRSSAATTPAS